MIEEVMVYETNDGKQHVSADKAKDHITHIACEIISKRFKVAKQTGFCAATDEYKIVMALAGDYDNLLKLYHELGEIVG